MTQSVTHQTDSCTEARVIRLLHHAIGQVFNRCTDTRINARDVAGQVVYIR
ncbi:MAG: hypothetical protein DDT34_02514 [Firmicutes bacterium]|nr:hypothetical protein [Bacillota bacterium]